MPPPPRLIFAGCAAVLLMLGCARKAVTDASQPAAAELPVSARLTKVRTEAFQLASKNNIDGAIDKYKQARELAVAEGNMALAIRFLSNIAACLQLTSSYREAIQQYDFAAREARKNGFPKLESVALVNKASLMLETGDHRAAAEILKSIALDGSTLPEEGRLAAFALQINLFTRLKQSAEAHQAYLRAMHEAERTPSPAFLAANQKLHKKYPAGPIELRRAWVHSVYAQALAWADQSAAAEAYALEAFRLRSLYGDPLRFRDALQLAVIYRRLNRYEEAGRMLEVTNEIQPTGQISMQRFLAQRERARLALARGQFDEALPPLRNALATARRWRMQLVPTDAAFLNFESYLTGEVQKEFLGALLQPEFDLSQAGVAIESLWIAEEARFASMRAAQFPATAFSERLPAAYWTTLARYQKMQDTVLATGKEADTDALARLDSELKLIEAQAGLTLPKNTQSGLPASSEWLASLKPDEAIFSYYLAEPYSLAWTVANRKVTVRRIAGRGEIAKLVEAFRQEVLNPSQNGTSSAGLKLSKQLFGENLSVSRTIPFWTMVLDQELASLPIAALPGSADGSRYLISDHTLRAVPSVFSLSQEQRTNWSHFAAAFGDPVYNRADARMTPAVSGVFQPVGLNRLPQSGKEVELMSAMLERRGWETETRTGLRATAPELLGILRRSPDIVHISSHFVSLPDSPHTISVALSAGANGGTSALFGSRDLNAIRTQTKLVVLSGCSSSTGEIIPGIGINGLSRALLISGVGTVVATLWPTVDTDGPIFPTFYRHLTANAWSSRATAESLRQAQLEMIRQGGWTARPAYWAAYLPISRG